MAFYLFFIIIGIWRNLGALTLQKISKLWVSPPKSLRPLNVSDESDIWNINLKRGGTFLITYRYSGS